MLFDTEANSIVRSCIEVQYIRFKSRIHYRKLKAKIIIHKAKHKRNGST